LPEGFAVAGSNRPPNNPDPEAWKERLFVGLAILIVLLLMPLFLGLLLGGAALGAVVGWSATGGPIGGGIGAGLGGGLVAGLFLRFFVGDKPVEAGCGAVITGALIGVIAGSLAREVAQYLQERRKGQQQALLLVEGGKGPCASRSRRAGSDRSWRAGSVSDRSA
jgi:hypothetical protein